MKKNKTLKKILTVAAIVVVFAVSTGKLTAAENPCGTGSHLCGYDDNGNALCCTDGTNCCMKWWPWGGLRSFKCTSGTQTC